MTEETVIICVPWGAQSVESTRAACRSCGKALACSKVTRADLPADVQFECALCAAAADPDCTPRVTPGTRREVAAQIGVDPVMAGRIPTLAELIRRGGRW